ncbi:MAG TPA: N-acetylmuramoyl-L-alanine amidase [Burkholderiaceae bacterium]
MPWFQPACLGRVASLLACLLAACAPLPQRAGIPTEWQPSPNFNERRADTVVIHYTGADRAADALRTLSSPQARVSAHYLVVRDGTIIQLVDERSRAWHAGASRWGSSIDVNSSSIGIELDNNGSEPYPQVQIDALLALLADLRQRYRLPAANFVGHSDVAPRRKVDPGPLFPWRMLAAHGFGLWCEPPYPDAPPEFDATTGLRVLGYDTRQPEAAWSAFRLHYLPDEPALEPNERDRALIYCLSRSQD